MAWREQLRDASFRGVAFFVESHDFSTGRRGVQHEFVQRDVPYTEDTGRKGRQFTITGYVLGADYMSARDAIIDACELEGPGELIHPYMGRKVVNCFDLKVRESQRDGGFAQLSFTFVEAGEQSFPDSKKDTALAVQQSAQSAIEKAKADFASKFSVLKQPAFVVDAARSKVQAFSNQVSAISKTYTSTTNAITDFAFTVRNLTANVNDLLNKPAEMAEQMASAMNFLRGAGAKVEETLGAMKGLFGFGDDDKPISTTTTTRARQAQNQTALNDLIKQISLAEATQAAIEIEFNSVDDAEAERDFLVSTIDEQMNTASDDVYQAQQDLMANVIQGVPSPDKSLASISTYDLKQTSNSIVVVYDLYEQPTLESDIIARNGVSHPGFITGGQTLEVLQTDEAI